MINPTSRSVHHVRLYESVKMNDREPSPLFLDMSSPISDEFIHENFMSSTILNDTLNSIETNEIMMDDVNEVLPDKDLSRCRSF